MYELCLGGSYAGRRVHAHDRKQSETSARRIRRPTSEKSSRPKFQHVSNLFHSLLRRKRVSKIPAQATEVVLRCLYACETEGASTAASHPAEMPAAELLRSLVENNFES